MFNSGGTGILPVMNVDGRSDGNGWGGDGGWWVLIILFALFGGWGGNGFGAGNGGAPVHGYTPTHPMNPHMPMMDHEEHESMGYPNMSKSRMGYPMDTQPYHEYDKARKHYHETKDANEKMKMEHHADQYIHDVSDSIRDMWNDATPEMKKKIKGDMSKLLAEMAV